jgi:hypothetical protein
MKFIGLIIFLFIGLQTFSQDSLSNKTIGIGTGTIYFPTGKIIGFSHNYFANYKFSIHFGIQLGLEYGTGQKNDEFYFDNAKSTGIYSSLTYIPFKNIKNLQINSSFMFLKITNIFGTKDEILNSNFSMSKFSTFKKSSFYGLNLGLQIPIYETTDFIFTTKIDSWTSLLQINAVSLKLQIQYKISKQ